ncbi:hypothetical protein JG687_00008665 [Phytophthora cactorum]|uniref:Uncharacterized protein n=1 Tax=Phytophthora cactorum TaxID=29920 RepID=A0A8T1UEX5_9STRA|nr:hypothetical protein JG687_00008665 [Phytophthora cactorum]
MCKKPVQEVKCQRMNEARNEAKQLVQGTLLPVVTLSDISRLLLSSYSYESACGILSSFAVKDIRPRKKTIAREITQSESSNRVQFSLTRSLHESAYEH